MPLSNKTALIPGASRPVGRAIARLFAARGAHLVLPVYDWPESIAEMRQEFNSEGISADILTLDLRTETAALTLARRIEAGRGLDYLINNIERGGMPVVHGSYDLPHNADQWQRELDTTLKAKWLLFHHCFPLMQKDGAVVNISSIAGQCGRSGAGAAFFSDGYSAANRAVQSLTETWARQAAPTIRVNELVLGLIQSRHGEGTRGWDALTKEEKEEILGNILLNRTGFTEEVARTVFFLAVEASYMTGSVVRMDGGLALGATRVPPLPPGIL